MRDQRTVTAVTIHVMLNMIRRAQPQQNRHYLGFFKLRRCQKLTISNLRQAVMLPRLMIHSILNNKIILGHQIVVLVYEYSSHFHSVVWN